MNKKLVLLSASLLLAAGSLMAQKRVTGTVLDNEGHPVVGATVKVQGTKIVVVTDENGKFSLSSVPANAKHLDISYLGMKPTSANIAANVRVTMQPSETLLDEAIVVAYGTAKKSSFTGSAAQVKGEKIEQRVTSNVANALTGQLSGVQTFSGSGAPGSTPTIRVRGFGSMSASNNPLYIVDGVPYDGLISSLNPADIESMSVLKDAAANAIYGARGANGVVVITTKQGRSQDAVVTVDAKWGSNRRAIPNYDVISSPAEYYETAYKALYNSQAYNGKSAAEAYAYANKNLLDAANGGLGYQIYSVPAGQNLIGTNFKLNPNATLGYSDGEFYYTPDDWYEEFFGKGNLRQEYNVNVSGRSDRMSYYASVGYVDDSGLVNNSSFRRYSGRGKVDYQAKKWLKIGTNMDFSESTNKGNGSSSAGSSANLFDLTNMIAPIYPLYVRNIDGTIRMNEPTGTPLYDNGANTTNAKRPYQGNARPGAIIDNDRNTLISSTLNGKWYADITPVEGLKLSAVISVSDVNQRSSSLSSRWGSSNATEDGSVSVGHTHQTGVNQQYLASYIHTFGGVHNIDLLAGYEQYKLRVQSLSGYNDHLFNPFIGELNNAGGFSNQSNGSSQGHYMTEGILSRVQYNYLEKYFLSASYRRDASSRFHKDSRWGNFGSIGGAWLLSKEDFMASTRNWIDLLKLKASWGVQGNDNLGNDYPYMDQYSWSYSETTGEYSKILAYKGNKDITWETSYAFNIGAEFELFKGRLSGGIEFYNRKTVDMLYNQPTPLSSGILTGFIPTNIGSMVNRGVEVDLYGVLVRTKNFSWDVNFNLSHNYNKVLELSDDVKETGITSSGRIIRENGSLYNSYLKRYAGVDPETGLAQYYVDPDNGDWSLTTNYETAQKSDLGSTLPKIYGGFGTSLHFYGFDFSVQMSYQLGGRAYDPSYQRLMHTGNTSNIGSNWHTDIRNAWTPENRYTDVPRLSASDACYQLDSDRFLMSSDYISFNNVTLGYTVPETLLKRFGVNGLRLYVTGDNLGVISTRKGFDPRNMYGAGSSLSTGNAGYTAMRNISGGLTLTF